MHPATILCLAFAAPVLQDESSPFGEALEQAAAFCDAGQPELAEPWIRRALERDPNSVEAWGLRRRWAQGLGDRDEEVYAAHRQYRLAVHQGLPPETLAAMRQDLEALDPLARELLDLRDVFVDKLEPIALDYEKDQRPHSAIRVHQEILALDPERAASLEAIERISAQPDPALAETAKPRDLLEGVSEEWIRKHDARTSTWEDRAKLTRENYVTHTDAGYEVLVRSAEAMEQMNAFYRQFFQYGTPRDGKNVSRIELRIFKNRDEYLKLGTSPAEWSGGQFTGSAVETYVSGNGFEDMTSTLFHEAAHQFVSLATSASGWLNEGLASFFEGTRILGNGTVQMNLPANHRLFPLATRMEEGWMADENDGIDPEKPDASTPRRAPTFQIILGNRYAWGPPWYAPTWGFVYFLYNFQDEVDGRFVYRKAFQEFINSSGSRVGDGAVKNFEEVILANPQKPTRGVEDASESWPRTAEELNDLWKDWILKLRDEQAGRLKVVRPHLDWARHAVQRKDYEDAREFFEKGLKEEPQNVELLLDFAELLATRFDDDDRGAKLARTALRTLEAEDTPDPEKLRQAQRVLQDLDPREKLTTTLRERLLASASGLAQRYLAADLPLMTMDISWRLGTDLHLSALFDHFEEAVRRSGKSLAMWRLAYNEHDLEGWGTSDNNPIWFTNGPEITSSFGERKTGLTEFRFLSCDQVTSGDYSFEAEVFADPSKATYCGLTFGLKDATTFHGVILHAGNVQPEPSRDAFLDVSSFYGDGPEDFEIYRHNSVGRAEARWRKLRLDVVGRLVDVWLDGEYVVTQEFPNLEVLRGRFGLMTGPGEVKWRNIRFLARDPLDLASRIEREVTMQRLRDKAAAEGRPLGGSYLGLIPPFPVVKEWVQDPRASWEERGPVPTMVVLWGISQNDSLPLHDWLQWVWEEYSDVDLQIVAVAAPDDAPKLREYLKTHAFPGSVASDVRHGVGYGETFELFLIHRFNMPRVLLMDVDHRVVWEGDPGMERGLSWEPGMETYVDAPLEQLVERRKLREVQDWLDRWARDGAPALLSGDFPAALPLLTELEGLRAAEFQPQIRDVLQKNDILRSSLLALETTAQTLARTGGEGAIPVLLDWAQEAGTPPSSAVLKELKRDASSPNAKSWKTTEEEVTRVAKRVREDRPEKTLEEAGKLLESLGTALDAISIWYHDRLENAVEGGDAGEVVRVLGAIDGAAGAWFIQEHLQWEGTAGAGPAAGTGPGPGAGG